VHAGDERRGAEDGAREVEAVTSPCAFPRRLLHCGGAGTTPIWTSIAIVSMRTRESLGGAAVLRKVRALHGELDASERRALAIEIDEVREVLSAIARELRGR
jgi:hypothetical protein